MENQNYYQILGVTKDATDKEMKDAYRLRAIACHPDKNLGDPEMKEKFTVSSTIYWLVLIN